MRSARAPRLPILRLAVEAAGMQLGPFVAGLAGMAELAPIVRGATDPADLDASAVEALIDVFVARGFRHPRSPLLSAAQLATLDACARQLGLSGRDYIRLIRHSTDGVSRRLMTGTHFIALWAVFDHYGVAEWRPAPGYVDRRLAGALRRAAWHGGVPEADVRDLIMRFGGTTRIRELHERAFARVMIALGQRGGVAPAPAPRVEGEPGMVTQAQANLIWRLWHETRRGRNAGERSLEIAIGHLLGLPGGFDTLTRAGARAVMDAFKASLVQPIDLSNRRLIDGLSSNEGGDGLAMRDGH